MKKLLFMAAMLVFAYTASAQLLAPKGLKVGKTADVITITRITSDGSNIKFYSGNVLLSPEDPDTVDFASVGVLKKDTVNVTTGSYTSRYDFKNEPTRHEYIKVLNKLGAGIKLSPIMPSGGSFVGSSNQMIDQRASYVLAYVQDTVSVSSIQYQMHSAGNYTVDGTEFNGIAIYSTSGTTATRIAITANTATAWTQAANTVATLNLTAPVTLYPGLYYVGFLYNYLVQTTAPYIVGLQPGTIYTGTVLSNSMSLGIFYSSVTQFPASFTISSTQQLGILHNFIGK